MLYAFKPSVRHRFTQDSIHSLLVISTRKEEVGPRLTANCYGRRKTTTNDFLRNHHPTDQPTNQPPHQHQAKQVGWVEVERVPSPKTQQFPSRSSSLARQKVDSTILLRLGLIYAVLVTDERPSPFPSILTLRLLTDRAQVWYCPFRECVSCECPDEGIVSRARPPVLFSRFVRFGHHSE